MTLHNPKPARRASPFKQVDVTRAIKGAEAAGFQPGEFRIAPDGTIQVMRAGAMSVGGNRIDQMIGGRHGKA